MSISAEKRVEMASAEPVSNQQNSYETDFYAWTQHQAALLRTRRLNELDIVNLIEEIEGLGRSEKRELESRLKVLLMHLLKWQFQPARRSRSWLATIRNQRNELRKLLRDNPSLAANLTRILDEAYQDARYEAEAETGLAISVFPQSCPYLIEHTLQIDWLPAENIES
jgi:hypothetical protein